MVLPIQTHSLLRSYYVSPEGGLNYNHNYCTICDLRSILIYWNSCDLFKINFSKYIVFYSRLLISKYKDKCSNVQMLYNEVWLNSVDTACRYYWYLYKGQRDVFFNIIDSINTNYLVYSLKQVISIHLYLKFNVHGKMKHIL